MCEDPGTPAGAVQIVSASAYHVDAEVHIQCLREGYEPAGATTLLCQSVDNATAMWNEPISECVGKKNFRVLTHWPLGDVAVILIEKISNSLYRMVARILAMKLLSGEWHWISVMISQHWFR